MEDHHFFWDASLPGMKFKDNPELEATVKEMALTMDLVCRVLMRDTKPDLEKMALEWAKQSVASNSSTAPIADNDNANSTNMTTLPDLITWLCRHPHLLKKFLNDRNLYGVPDQHFKAVYGVVIDCLIRVVYSSYSHDVDPFAKDDDVLGNSVKRASSLTFGPEKKHGRQISAASNSQLSPPYSPRVQYAHDSFQWTSVRLYQYLVIPNALSEFPYPLYRTRIDMLQAAATIEAFKLELADVFRYLTDRSERVALSTEEDDVAWDSICSLIPIIAFSKYDEEGVLTDMSNWASRYHRSTTVLHLEEVIEVLTDIKVWINENLVTSANQHLNIQAQRRIEVIVKKLDEETQSCSDGETHCCSNENTQCSCSDKGTDNPL